jgi:hypothetical protein
MLVFFLGEVADDWKDSEVNGTNNNTEDKNNIQNFGILIYDNLIVKLSQTQLK